MDDFDYSKMCLGSEMLGTRVSATHLRCRKCNQIIGAFSPTENLVPVHSDVLEDEEGE